MPRRIGEEVVENLDDAAPVCQHPGQVGRQIDQDGMAAATTQEGVPGLVHQVGYLGRLRPDRQSPRLDAACVQQVADQALHVIGLLFDDTEKLRHLGRVRRGFLDGGGQALDGAQRHAQFVTHQAEKLGSRPLQLLQRGHVLQGNDHRLDPALLGMDRRGVDQGGEAPAAGDLEHDLFGTHCHCAAQHLQQGRLIQ